uniref:TCTP domain-containing protein n=2 Tax=Hemiselmis andersenii TaxID=464988 RepID=A0A7S0Y7F1_HEMAN
MALSPGLALGGESSALLGRIRPTPKDSRAPVMRLRGGMLIYKDIVSGDEMMSDSFPIEEIDDVMLKVTTKSVVKGAVEVDIGANAAAGDGEAGAAEDEGVDDTAVKVNDVVDAFNLQSMGAFDKKGILSWVKGYLKAIKERLDKDDPDRSAVFQEKSQKWVKDVLLKSPDDFEFYSGPSFNTEGALAMMVYEGENLAPHCYLFKDGLQEEKC